MSTNLVYYYKRKANVSILIGIPGILFVLLPFASFLWCIFLLFVWQFNRREYLVIYFLISLYLGLLAFTQSTDVGDISRTYDGVLRALAFPIDDALMFAWFDSHYVFHATANLLLTYLTGNVQYISFLWVFLVYYFFFLGLLNLLECRELRLTPRLMGWLTLVSLLCFIFFTQVTEIQKQAVNTSMVFYAYSLYLKGKTTNAYIVFAISLTMHFTALILAPVLFFANKLKPKIIWLIVSLSFFLRLININSIINKAFSGISFLASLSEISGRYTETLDGFLQSSAPYFSLTFWGYACFVLLLICHHKKMTGIDKGLLLYIAMLNLNYGSNNNFCRLLITMWPFYTIIFIELWKIKYKSFFVQLTLFLFSSWTLMLNARINDSRIGPEASYPTTFMDNSLYKVIFSTSFDYLNHKY